MGKVSCRSVRERYCKVEYRLFTLGGQLYLIAGTTKKKKNTTKIVEISWAKKERST